MDTVELCRRRGGVARTSELRAAGATASGLRRAVGGGLLLQPRRGLYCLPSASPAAVEALAHRGRVACVTAARAYRLWTLDTGADEPVHTWIDPDRHGVDVDGCTCVRHRDGRIGEPRLWVVGLLHCLVQIAWCRGDEAFFAALESALRRRILPPGGLSQLRDAVPATMRWLVDFARTDADSGLESLVRLRLHRLGIPVRTQVRIGGVGVVDFVVGDRLILETDGETHGGDHRHKDLVRDATALALGFVTLRFDSAMVLHDWSLAEAAILAAVADGLHLSRGPIRV